MSTYGRAVEIRYAACKPADFPAFLKTILGSPMPGWTGLVNEEPANDPPFDHTMVCKSAHLLPKMKLGDGRVKVELHYEECD